MDLISNLNKLNNYRELKNLGSRLQDVRPYDSVERSGYEIIYTEGDVCLADPSKHYETHINYRCDTSSQSKLHDYPMLVPIDAQQGYTGSNQCKFFFVWHSPFACSVCQLD